LPPDGLSIGELARRTSVTADTLRYYEKAGLLSPPPRNEAGRRRYPEAAVGVVEVIRALRGAGFGIGEIRTVLEAKTQGAGGAQNVRSVAAALVSLRERVEARRVALEAATALLDAWLSELREQELAGRARRS
jgi:DNA-binding transcriptional MerR regulator